MTEAILLLVVLCTVLLNYFLAVRWRPHFLLLVSLSLVSWYSIESLLSILVLGFFNYLMGTIVKNGKIFLVFGILVNVAAIIGFNYFVAIGTEFRFELRTIQFNLSNFVLSIGISFYSLQHISYLLDVSHKRIRVVTNLVHFLLYQSFFPRLISGPVMQPRAFIAQLKQIHTGKDKLIAGFQRSLLGLFKKMVLADALAPSVHSVFDYSQHYSGLTILAACFLFTLQLYFDFSGYTDLALGIARMLGIELIENFRTPFRSNSISEFWRRWHISLISWFSDHVYYPVVYKFRAFKKWAALTGIVLTFMISGLWHGIGCTFFVWAALHVVYLSFELFLKSFVPQRNTAAKLNVVRLGQSLLVFLLVSFSNLFFRAESWQRASEMARDLFTSANFFPADRLKDFLSVLAVGGTQQELFNFLVVLLFAAVFLIWENKWNALAVSKKLQPGYVFAVLLLLFLFGVFNSGERFIYMQF